MTERGCLMTRLLEPGAHARIGIAVLGDVADDGDRVGANGKYRGRPFKSNAAYGDQG